MVMYAKVINGEAVLATTRKGIFYVEDVQIINPRDEDFRRYGYKPIVCYVPPESEDMISIYTETETEIVETWVYPE